MLSVDDVTPTPEVDDDVLVTSSCRRSSMSCDGDESGSVSLRRCGSFRGSMSSLAVGTVPWRRESIVEALEKKCRENVSNRLRSQLPPHLHKSLTNACTDLPVIVRAANTSLPRPSTPASSYQHRAVTLTQGITEPPRRPSCPLYQGITQGSSLQQLRCSGRRHSTAIPDRWTRSLSLSRQTRRSDCDLTKQEGTASASWSSTHIDTGKRTTLPTRLQCEHVQGSDDLLDQTEPTSVWLSTLNDQDWAASKRTILSTRLQPNYDLQRANDLGAELPRSTWSPETDRTADCDVNADSSATDTDSCDEVSVNSFTFSSSTSQAHELNTSSAVAAGTDDRSKEVIVDDSNNVDSTQSFDTELQTTGDLINTALTNKVLTSGSLVCSDMTDTNIALSRRREIDNKAAQLDHVDDGPAHDTHCWNNGQYKTADLVSMSSKDSPIEDSKSISQSASTEGTLSDRPRYRTSISLSIGPPSVSTMTSKSFYQSNLQQPVGHQSSDEPSQPSACHSDNWIDTAASPPPPPLLSTNSDNADLRQSHSDDEWSEDDQMSGQLASRQSPVENRRCHEDDRDVKGDDQRLTDKRENTDAKSDEVEIKNVCDDVTSVTTATASRVLTTRSATDVTNVNSQSLVSNAVNSATTPAATVNNGQHVFNEQKSYRCTASQNEATRLKETDDVQSHTRRLADDRASEKNGQDTTADYGTMVSSVVLHRPTQSQQSATIVSHFERQVNGFHREYKGPSMTQQFKGICKSYVNVPGSYTMTSHGVTSWHVTSGLPRPMSVVNTPVTSRVMVTPVPVGVDSQSTVSRPSVDRSWETLRTDKTRTAVLPHKTTLSHRVCTAGALDETARRPVVVIHHVRNTDDCRFSAAPILSTLDATQTAEHCVGSESSCGHLDRIDIVVQKTGLALGFSIDGGSDKPITVKKVFRDDVKLRAGDEILSANGRPLSNLSHFVALNFLKSLPDGKVHLAVQRYVQQSAMMGSKK